MSTQCKKQFFYAQIGLCDIYKDKIVVLVDVAVHTKLY